MGDSFVDFMSAKTCQNEPKLYFDRLAGPFRRTQFAWAGQLIQDNRRSAPRMSSELESSRTEPLLVPFYAWDGSARQRFAQSQPVGGVEAVSKFLGILHINGAFFVALRPCWFDTESYCLLLTIII